MGSDALVNKTDQVPTLTIWQERESPSKQAKTCLVPDCGQSYGGEPRDAGEAVWGAGEGTNGGRVVREAFIRDLREEKWPAMGGVGGEHSRGGSLLFCVSLTPHASWEPAQSRGLHWG